MLGRALRSLTPAQINAVSGEWKGKVLGEGAIRADPDSTSRASETGQAVARALVAAFVSSDKAAAYDEAPLLVQADMLLEAGAAVLTSRPWPTAYLLFLNDTSGGYQGRSLVALYLGKSTEEYNKWPKMTDRERGEAAKKALLAAFHVSRQLAQGKISLDEWEGTLHASLDRINVDGTILLAGGRELMKRYSAATDEERRQILIASELKSVGWVWTLQGAL
jgi:hypothetical protein